MIYTHALKQFKFWKIRCNVVFALLLMAEKYTDSNQRWGAGPVALLFLCELSCIDGNITLGNSKFMLNISEIF